MSAVTLEDLKAAVDRQNEELDALKAELAALKEQFAADARGRDAEIDAETLVMLAAAVTSYLGKRVRIRSARLVQPGPEGAPAWARHGRAAIQTSHQLRRGR